LPEFSDVKMFVDSLLVSYQTGVDIGFELERTAMICTPFRRDFINGKVEDHSDERSTLTFISESGSALVTFVIIVIDFVFLIP
jgi:hypothetical protein